LRSQNKVKSTIYDQISIPFGGKKIVNIGTVDPVTISLPEIFKEKV